MRPFVGRDTPYGDLEEADREALEADLSGVPSEARRTIRAAGLGGLVARALAQRRRSDRPSLETLLTRQELGMRLISLETQLAAVIFEAECTGELIEAMSFELEDRADLRELRLALGSLVVGAASAAAAGIWDLSAEGSRGPPVLGLVGGTGSAAIGAAAFVKRPEHMEFMHRRNLLAPVVTGVDADELFPRFVFRLLVLPAPNGELPPRERLLARFRELIDGVVGHAQRPAAEALLYGEGGRYNQELLALRERLYDALESEVNALARDLELLDRFLVRTLERVEPDVP